MQSSVSQHLGKVAGGMTREAVSVPLKALAARMATQATSSAGLVIKAGGGVLAKIGATAFAGVVQGHPVAIAASTDMPAIPVTITAASYNVVCFFIDKASVVTAVGGKEHTTLAGVTFPQFPLNKALVGYLIITHSSTFTGGTTALDTATTVYVSPVGAFDPSITI